MIDYGKAGVGIGTQGWESGVKGILMRYLDQEPDILSA